jgi:hypothetical protein
LKICASSPWVCGVYFRGYEAFIIDSNADLAPLPIQRSALTRRDDELARGNSDHRRLRRQGGNHQPLGMKKAKHANAQIPCGTDARRQQNEHERGLGKACSDAILLVTVDHGV